VKIGRADQQRQRKRRQTDLPLRRLRLDDRAPPSGPQPEWCGQQAEDQAEEQPELRPPPPHNINEQPRLIKDYEERDKA
jgi:hypothetical protein